MSNDSTIFDLQQSKKESEFIVSTIDYEIDAGSEIFEHACDLPYVGSLFKLSKVAINYFNLRFYKKLGLFLKQSNEIPEEKKIKFIDGLTKKDKTRISNYLTHLLFSANEDEKAEIMGKIYKRRLLDEIDNEMMLRLCSIIERAFLPDLVHLKDYLEVSENNDHITDNLVSLGLLRDVGNVYEEHGDGWEGTAFGPTKNILNKVGLILYRILNDQPITQEEESQVVNDRTQIRPITEEEIDNICK